MVKIEYYCDRCGKPTNNDDNKIRIFRVREYLIWEDDGYEYHRKLVCEDCLKEFKKWFVGDEE